MKNCSFFTALMVCGLMVTAQPTYFQKSIGWGWVQASIKVYFTSDTSIVMGCGSYLNNTSLDRSHILFTNQYAENQTLLTYGEEFGSFTILDLITTPFGYAFCGWMNTSPYGTFPTATYSYPYIMEVDHAGEVLNLYQLPDPPYEGNGKVLLYYPETNTYYLGGNAFTTASNPDRLVMTKITDGEIVWRKYYDNFANRNYIVDLLPTADGGCYAVGTVNHKVGTQLSEVLFMRINANGDMLFNKTYKWGDSRAVGNRFNFASNNNLIITGASLGKAALLLRIDTMGNTVWARHYELGSAFSETVNVFQVGDHFVCAGSCRDVGGKVKAFLMKVRGTDGEPLWVRYFDAEPNSDYFYDFTPAPDGGFMCVGRTEPVGSANVLAVRTNCMGLLTLPQAGFTVVQDTSAVPDLFTFINQSQYVYPDSIDGGHFIWEFGDGAVSYQVNPTHIYPAAGEYLVTLTAIVCQDTSIYQMPVQVRSGSGIAVGLPANLPPSVGTEVVVFPNPASQYLQIQANLPAKRSATIAIYDVLGKLKWELPIQEKAEIQVNTSDWANGLYFYRVICNGAMISKGKFFVIK